MRAWTKILPVFIYQWLARRYCSRLHVLEQTWAEASTDILIKIK